MDRFKVFLGFLSEYFRGPTGLAEFREMFVCRGDPSSSRNKSRGVVWLHGLGAYITTFVKSLRRLKEWNIFMGVGFETEPGLTSPVLEKTLYDRLAFDFDSEEDPDTAVSQALSFAEYLNNRYSTTPIVFESGFKGAHVVVPLSKPVVWEVYQLLWKKLYGEMVVDQRKLVDANMLQWNRVDRVPLTYNVKESESRFARIIYPREFSWEDFNWRELEPLDPSSVRVVKVVVPQVVKPKVLAPAKSEKRAWVWRIVGNGLGDGRKRFMFMVLIPYLASIGKDEKEIVDICLEFIRNSCEKHGRCDKVYESWIRGVIRSSRSSGFRGFSLKTLREKDPDLYERIQAVLDKEPAPVETEATSYLLDLGEGSA